MVIRKEDEYNQISNVIDDATASNSVQPETINELKQTQVQAETNLRCVKLVAENVADKRDKTLRKELRKFIKRIF